MVSLRSIEFGCLIISCIDDCGINTHYLVGLGDACRALVRRMGPSLHVIGWIQKRKLTLVVNQELGTRVVSGDEAIKIL
jgi:hypothetical protein